MTLSDVLAPVALAEFLREYVGQRFAAIKGMPGRFQHLVRWRDLNEALTHLRVDGERAFLIKNGVPIAPAAYQFASGSGGGKLLDGPAVTKHVAGGATLVVNKIDELLPGVRALAESCEQVFQIYAGVNLYAGWRTDKGFEVHWDQHDTLILQIRGAKDWTVWAPTRLHPLHDDPHDREAPSSDPAWKGTLEDGDVLYMPRGWWHVAYPRDELSLHLTIGLRHRTGVDLLGWVIDQLKESVYARMDVPHWKTADEQVVWVDAIHEAIYAALADGVIDRYMRSVTSSAHVRPIVSLRDRITAEPTIDDDTPLRLTSGPKLTFTDQAGDGTASFTVNGVDWQCHATLVPALGRLNHITPCTLADMKGLVPPMMRSLLRPFVTVLVLSEVIWAEPPVEDDDIVARPRIVERQAV